VLSAECGVHATPHSARRTPHEYDHPVPKARLPAVWLTALAVAATLLAVSGYRTRDPDSRAYIAIATRLADVPAAEWIAPQWWGAWGGQGRFLEHPAGAFVLPALLTRAGYPAAQASFVVTLAAQIVSLLVLVSLASRLLPQADARAIAWALLLIPIAFVFRIRANQEYLVLAGVLVSIYGLERARTSAAWAMLAVAGCLFALAVKGVFALVAPIAGGLWLWARRPNPAMAWVALALMIAAIPLATWGYERAYVRVTEESFLEYYLGARTSLAAGAASSLPFPINKIWNMAWYIGRVVWYAAPWSLALVLAGRAGSLESPTRRFVAFSVFATLAAILLVAPRDLRADRYVFPAYFFAASGGVALACARVARIRDLTAQLDRTWPWGPALLWVVLVAGRIWL
jgi:hypothetical protein